jgi:hypothetical protein
MPPLQAKPGELMVMSAVEWIDLPPNKYATVGALRKGIVLIRNGEGDIGKPVDWCHVDWRDDWKRYQSDIVVLRATDRVCMCGAMGKHYWFQFVET